MFRIYNFAVRFCLLSKFIDVVTSLFYGYSTLTSSAFSEIPMVLGAVLGQSVVQNVPCVAIRGQAGGRLHTLLTRR